MYKFIAFFIVLLLCISMLAAQEDVVYDESGDQVYNDQEPEDVEPVTPVVINKYIVALVSLVFIVALYYLFLSLYPKLLENNVGPLAGAATQCLRFALLSAVVILFALFALSGFVMANIRETLEANLGFIIFITVVWFVYLIITISNKSKGGSNAR